MLGSYLKHSQLAQKSMLSVQYKQRCPFLGFNHLRVTYSSKNSTKMLPRKIHSNNKCKRSNNCFTITYITLRSVKWYWQKLSLLFFKIIMRIRDSYIQDETCPILKLSFPLKWNSLFNHKNVPFSLQDFNPEKKVMFYLLLVDLNFLT